MVVDTQVVDIHRVAVPRGVDHAEGDEASCAAVVTQRGLYGLPCIGGGVLHRVDGDEGADVVLVVHHAYNHQELGAVAVEVEIEVEAAERVDCHVGHDGIAAAVVVAVVVELDDAVVVLAGVVAVAAVVACPSCGHLVVGGVVEVVAIGQFHLLRGGERGGWCAGGDLFEAAGKEVVGAVGLQTGDVVWVLGDVHKGVGAVALGAAVGTVLNPVVGGGAFGECGLHLPCTGHGEVGQGAGRDHQVVEIEGVAAAGGGDEEGDEAARAFVAGQRDMLGIVDIIGRAGERVDRGEGVEIGTVVHHADDEPHAADVFHAERELEVEMLHAVDIEVGEGGVLQVVVVGVEIHGAAAAVVVAAVGAGIVVAVGAEAVPSRGHGEVGVVVEIVAVGEGHGVGGAEGVGEAELFARRADEEDLVGLRGFEAGEQCLAAVAGHRAPVVAIAVEEGVVRVVVLPAPGDAACGGSVYGAVEPRGVGIVGDGEAREPDPAAAGGAAGADGQTVEGGAAADELDVELLQLVGLSVAERGHLDESVGVGGVGE